MNLTSIEFFFQYIGRFVSVAVLARKYIRLYKKPLNVKNEGCFMTLKVKIDLRGIEINT